MSEEMLRHHLVPREGTNHGKLLAALESLISNDALAPRSTKVQSARRHQAHPTRQPRLF
jgi:hypothetical protein